MENSWIKFGIRNISVKCPKEYYYHAFLNGYFSSQQDSFSSYASNAEADNGYADIAFESNDRKTAIIIEIKHTDSENKARDVAEAAITQIEKKKYTDIFANSDIKKSILCYGICFFKKSCTVAFKEICNFSF